MNLANYLQFLEPMQEQFGRIYSTMSGLIVVLLGLWLFNFIAGLIHRTYSTGKAFGGFYRNYLHNGFKSLTSNIFLMFKKDDSKSEVRPIN